MAFELIADRIDHPFGALEK